MNVNHRDFEPTQEKRSLSTTYNFSGHETFACRHYWLKKGYDFVSAQKDFNSPEAVVDLGVGNNMVRSIRYWLKAFDLVDNNNELTDLAKRIFKDNGWDPFIEDEGTLWLLHYKLNKKAHASIYPLIFNELRIQKPEFTRTHFFNFVSILNTSTTQGTLKNDFSVFHRNYLNDRNKDIEDGYTGLLTDLNLLKQIKVEKEVFYHIENRERPEVPAEIILYAVADDERYGNSISFDNLYLDNGSVANIFALSKEGLVERLQKIAEKYPRQVIFNIDPLARQIQFKDSKPDPLNVLEDYYTKKE